MRPAALLLTWALGACAALAPAAALAQAGEDPQQLAAAQAIFDQAVVAMNDKRFDEACPRLEEVVKLIPAGIGARMTLAECYEGAGKSASAWTTYVVVEGAARAAGQAEREKTAHERAEALRPKLAQLTIVVPDAVRSVPGLAVRRDGVDVGPVQLGVPLPVDRGEHRIVASADGRAARTTTIEVPEDGATLTVTIEGWPDAPPPPPAPAVPGGGPPVQRWLGLGLAGLGLVGLGVGTVFGVGALGKQSEAEPHCDAKNVCDAEGLRLREEGLASGDAATAFFVAGGVLLGAGAVLFLTAPKAAPARVGVAVGPASAQVVGQW